MVHELETKRIPASAKNVVMMTLSLLLTLSDLSFKCQFNWNVTERKSFCLLWKNAKLEIRNGI